MAFISVAGGHASGLVSGVGCSHKQARWQGRAKWFGSGGNDPMSCYLTPFSAPGQYQWWVGRVGTKKA